MQKIGFKKTTQTIEICSSRKGRNYYKLL